MKTNLAKILKQKRDAEDRLRNRSQQPVFRDDGSIQSFASNIIRIFVQPTQPSARTKDLWVDTDDYSRYEKTALTSVATLAVSANEFITASGTFTITLHAATSSGIVKKIYNIGTGIITIVGTINGISNMLLYPGESVELITEGTAWRY